MNTEYTICMGFANTFSLLYIHYHWRKSHGLTKTTRQQPSTKSLLQQLIDSLSNNWIHSWEENLARYYCFKNRQDRSLMKSKRKLK
jgi:hypothetical protein